MILTYLGKPCKDCGGRERYVSSHHCITCAKDRAAERERKKRAEKKRQKKFHSPARQCGTSKLIPDSRYPFRQVKCLRCTEEFKGSTVNRICPRCTNETIY